MIETNQKQEIKRRLTRGLWWAAFIASITLTLASLPGYMQQLKELELTSGFATIQQTAQWLATFLSIGSVILCLALALLVFLKRPDESMSMFLSFFLLSYGILMLGPMEHFMPYWFPQYSELVFLVQAIFFSPVACSLLLVFPNGRFTPRWTRWLVVFSVLLTVTFLLIFELDEWVRGTTTRSRAGYAIWGALFLVAFGVQHYRYRRIYSQTERQQTKWVLIGIAATFFLAVICSFPYYYLLNLPPGTEQPWWAPVGSAGWWFAMMLIPLSLTVAILRYRLWNIDVIIRKTLVYGALTATLALVFLGGVALLQGVVGRLTGTEDSPVVIVISTLLIAALFSPLRRRIQDFIDRRFYRRKYNAEQALEAFAETARKETDLEILSGKLVDVVSKTMQPESITLWLSPKAQTSPNLSKEEN